MAHWQLKLDLMDIWNQAQEETLSLRDFGKEVLKRLQALDLSSMPDWVIEYHMEVVEEFETVIDEENLDLTQEEINGAMNMLYDWGDGALDDKIGGKRVCWIATEDF